MKKGFRKILNLILLLLLIICGAVFAGAVVQLLQPGKDDAALQADGADAQAGAEDVSAGRGGNTFVSLPEELSALFSCSGQAAEASDGYYAYSTLNDREKTIYDRIYGAFLNFDKETAIDRCDRETLRRVYYSVMSDHADVFWVDGFDSYLSTAALGRKIIFCPAYTMTEEEKKTAGEQADAVISDWLSGLAASADDYTKARYIYETLVDRVEYTAGAADNQNILSVFLNGKSVCQGIANAAAVLLQREGLQAAVVRGTADGSPHAWNLVRLDGEYYYLDATWGIPDFLDGSGQPKQVNYAYLNVTSEELSTTHTADVDFPLPDCTATADNYYRREGLFFAFLNHSAVGGALQRAYSSGSGQCSLKFSNAELFDEAKQYFITNGNIGLCCPGLTQIAYTERRDLLVLNIYYP